MTFDVPESAKANDTVAGDGDVWVNYWSKKEMIECKGAAGQDVTPFESNGADRGKLCADNQTTVTEFLYNWYAAIANDAEGVPPTDKGSADEGSIGRAELDSQAKGSICPRGWRLLEEGVVGDKQLITGHSEIDAFINVQKTNQEDWPGRLSTSGYFYSSQQHNVGSIGRWWSASRHSDANGRALAVFYDGAYLDGTNKHDGKSVRCILRNEQ